MIGSAANRVAEIGFDAYDTANMTQMAGNFVAGLGIAVDIVDLVQVRQKAEAVNTNLMIYVKSGDTADYVFLMVAVKDYFRLIPGPYGAIAGEVAEKVMLTGLH